VVWEDIFRSALKKEPLDFDWDEVEGTASEGPAFGVGTAGWDGVTCREEAVVLDLGA